MGKFHPIDRDSAFLLPLPMQEWLPEGHLARYMVEVVEHLDLSDLERAYAGKGSTAYHPALVLSLFLRLCYRLLLQSQDRAGNRRLARVS